MPRVKLTTKATYGKEYRCERCGQPITAGQQYYQWTKRNQPTRRQHQACGYPKASQLSNRKTAVIHDAISEVNWDVTVELPERTAAEWQEDGYTLSLEDAAEQIRSILEPVADQAREVGEEYAASADNLPEGLRYSPVGEAMDDVAERLEEWADQLADPDLESEVELDEDDRDGWQDQIDQAVAEMVDSAQSLLDEVPEYEG